MCITAQCLCKSYNSSKHSCRGVRCKTGHQMSNQIAFFLNVVERFHTVESCKLIINELCCSKQVFSTVVWNYNVLNPKFNDLVFIFNRVSIAVLFITHFKELFNADSNFFWYEMCKRQIGWIVAYCSILECEHFIFGPEYSLFKRFCQFWLWNHTYNTFYLVNSSYFHIIWCLFKHWC